MQKCGSVTLLLLIVAVVWSKRFLQGRIHNLLVDGARKALKTPEALHNKWSLRASWLGELLFKEVKVPSKPADRKIGFRCSLPCLGSAVMACLGAVGVAMDYDLRPCDGIQTNSI